MKDVIGLQPTADRAYGALGRAQYDVIRCLMNDPLTERQREDLREASQAIMVASEILLPYTKGDDTNEIRE